MSKVNLNYPNMPFFSVFFFATEPPSSIVAFDAIHRRNFDQFSVSLKNEVFAFYAFHTNSAPEREDKQRNRVAAN